MGEQEERHRLVVLGAGQVGKTSIVSRFLTGAFPSTYKATVEDLHCKDYEVNGSLIRVDILDTAGNLEFPAMRRLSISNAHAFLLVYALQDRSSFIEMTAIWEQIKELRSGYQDLPCVIVGNKADIQFDEPHLQFNDEAMEWMKREGLQHAAMEVSAKEDKCILSIFQLLLKIANVPAVRQLEPLLCRRMSAKENRNGSIRRKQAPSAACEEEGGAAAKLGRSRSLIRRVSRPKVKQTADVSRNDCTIS